MKHFARVTLLITITLACLIPGLAQTGNNTSSAATTDKQARKQAERERKEAERRRKAEEKEALRQAGARCSRLRNNR
ncbi:MAG TPA: hypothetical protein VGX92_03165 [Pyrinomonadaceae bacterium]|nr:hypothetical protein [Pyrinomonadaceae bacterium]